jgi:hypothetical protein
MMRSPLFVTTITLLAGCTSGPEPDTGGEREQSAVTQKASLFSDFVTEPGDEETEYYLDTDGNDAKRAGCIYRYADISDGVCKNQLPGAKGDVCVLSDPTALEEAITRTGKQRCAANQCCEEYLYIGYDCPTVCGDSKNKNFKCKVILNRCGKDRHSALCDCSGKAPDKFEEEAGELSPEAIIEGGGQEQL